MGLNEKFFRSADEDEPFFNTVLYDGTGVSNPITGVGFQPDLVWIKRRDVTALADHYIVDTVRGNGNNTYKNLASNEMQAEGTTTSSGITNSTIVDGGFTMQGTGARTNANGSDYVAWCWKAGGAAVSNTDGSINSQVSANVANGFSIVKWSGNNSNSNIGHGLSSAPQIVIRKNLLSSGNWAFDTSVIDGSSDYLFLNTTAGKANHTTVTVPTSTTFNTSGSSYNGSSMIAYCFHSVAGVSKVGSYVGSGAAGNLQVCGFEPSFVLIKLTDGTGSWWMSDNKRSPTNPVNDWMRADMDVGEYNLDGIDYEATGFSFNREYFNESGDNFIYYAIA